MQSVSAKLLPRPCLPAIRQGLAENRIRRINVRAITDAIANLWSLVASVPGLPVPLGANP
jgi:hypothetical protein